MSSGALSHLKVVELGGDSIAYAGKLLADLGAEVLKIEPPGGDPARQTPPFWGDQPAADRSLRFLYLHTNKRSVTLDLESAAERAEVERLLATTDVLLLGLAPSRLAALDLVPARLEADYPCLVVASVSGFGLDGPRRDWR